MTLDDATVALLDRIHRISVHDQKRKAERHAMIEDVLHRILSDNRAYSVNELVRMTGVGEHTMQKLLIRIHAEKLPETAKYRLHPTPLEILNRWPVVRDAPA